MGAGGAPVFGPPASTPASRPFSLTIRLKTSATERTPWAGFQSYLPDMTRASPVNLSESVPASFAKAACSSAGCDCAWLLLIAHSSGYWLSGYGTSAAQDQCLKEKRHAGSEMRQRVSVGRRCEGSIRSRYLRCLYLTVLAEYRQFHKCIICTMMLLFAHDSAMCWEEVLGTPFRRIQFSTTY